MTAQLIIAVLLAFFAPQAKSPGGGTLSGTVLNSATGEPLSKVDLRAELDGGPLSNGFSTTTDAHGNFKLVDLPVGQYRLESVRNGFLDTYYGARRAGSKGTTITLSAGQEIKDLVIKQLPFGVIAGTVRDADGEPLSGAAITLLRQRYDAPGHLKLEPYLGGVTTDDLGQYRIADLAPGKYYVEVDPKSELSLNDHSAKSSEPRTVTIPTLYPGVTDLASARLVEVGTGTRLVGIDISLVRARVFNVSGHVSANPGERVNLALYTLFHPGDGVGVIGLSFGSSGTVNGDFEFRGIPQGSYTLLTNNVDRIPLTVDHDIDDLRITLAGRTGVSGHISVEGGKSINLAGLPIRFSNSDLAPSELGEDNTFTANLYPGRYQVYLDLSNTNLTIKSIRSEQADVYQDGLTVSRGGKGQLEIVLAPEGAQLDGAVSDQDSKPVTGATVVLVAEPKFRLRVDSFHETTTDQYGRYHFANIRPGNYRLLAWDDIEPSAWYDPEFLRAFEAKGEPIVLAPNGHAVSNVPVLRGQ